jgi:YbgC/YbaW family acyl-CoA thioester hydrolase
MPDPFRTTRLVEFGDTDMAGIVHFANFFRYMEAAEQAFLRARGLSVVLDWEGQRLSFPRVAASCDYLRPARFEEVLDVTLTIARLGTKSITYAIEFHCGGKPIAKGQLSAVCCKVDAAAHRIEAVPIPERMRALLREDRAV